MNVIWKRILRTPSSKRILAMRARKEVAAIDLHYLASGTVILLKDARWKEDDIQHLLSGFDENFLPEVDLAHHTLTYTVVMGEVMRNFESVSK